MQAVKSGAEVDLVRVKDTVWVRDGAGELGRSVPSPTIHNA